MARDIRYFEFYTDGSLVNAQTEHLSMSFAFYQSFNLAPNVSFNATIEHWPSSTRAELYAILAVLLVVPQHSTTKIYTDSQSVITIFDQLSLIIPAPRKFVKITNYPEWSIIFDIIARHQLILRFIKVAAHTGNKYIDMVDTLAKEAHHDSLVSSFPISPVYMSNTLTYFPILSNVIVQQPLRPMRNILEYRRHLLWLDLHRNHKYRLLDVDWQSTYFYFNDEEDKSVTGFTTSSFKAHKIKFLIEEIPTRQQMKKSNPDLFDGCNCPMCGNADESFNHVWMCPQNLPTVQLIASNALDKLLTRICKYSKDGAAVKSNLGLAWLLLNVSYNHHSFTFIDIIKGIVPLLLFDKINFHLQNASITRRLISLYLHEIYT